MPTVTTPYGNLFYAHHIGTTTPLLLIHGAGSSHLAWSGELRRLRRAIALDLPGHGRSTGQGSDRIEIYAEAVKALLDATGISQVIPVGHSMGGAIAQTLALNYPERCTGLILVSTAAQMTVNEQILNLAHSDQAKVAGLINKWSWSLQAPPHLKAADLQYLQIIPPALLYGDYLACSRFDVTTRLAELKLPTLIFAGELDKMTPPVLGEALAVHISGAQLEIIPHAGHWVMLEQPQVVADKTATWLQEHQL